MANLGTIMLIAVAYFDSGAKVLYSQTTSQIYIYLAIVNDLVWPLSIKLHSTGNKQLKAPK